MFPGAATQSPAIRQNEGQEQERLRVEARAVAMVVDSRTVISPANRPASGVSSRLPVFGVLSGHVVATIYAEPSRPAVAQRVRYTVTYIVTTETHGVQAPARLVGLAAAVIDRSLPGDLQR